MLAFGPGGLVAPVDLFFFFFPRCLHLAPSAFWALSRSARNRAIHAMNGNGKGGRGGKARPGADCPEPAVPTGFAQVAGRGAGDRFSVLSTGCCPRPRLLTVILEPAVPDHLAMLWDRALLRALRELRWRPGPPSSRSWCTWATVWTSLLVMPIFFTFTAAASLRRAELLWWLL